MKIIQTVIDTLSEAGIPVMEAYPGLPVPHLTEPTAAVSLEKLDHMGRCAKILVTVMGPAAAGGAVCQDVAAQVGRLLEKLDGRCVQEECRFHGYADAFYVRVLADFYGSCVMEEWSDISSFVVKLGNTTVPNAVSFRAEQALDEATGIPLDSTVWTFRLEEEYTRGKSPMPEPEAPFDVTVMRSGTTEIYTDCSWTSMLVENTTTGLRQVSTGVAQSRSVIMII